MNYVNKDKDLIVKINFRSLSLSAAVAFQYDLISLRHAEQQLVIKATVYIVAFLVV